jgi:hypothetical protein
MLKKLALLFWLSILGIDEDEKLKMFWFRVKMQGR